MGVGDKVKEVTSSAKRRVGAEAPLAADEDGKIGVVRGALQAFGQGDMEKFVDALNDDVIWEGPEGSNFPGAGQHEGPDEVRKSFIGDVGRTYTSFGFVPDSFLETDQEDAVIVIGKFEGEGVEGANVDTPGVQIWGFKGSEVNHVRIFTDSCAFPEVVTEQKEKEWAEEERKKEEGDDEDESKDTESKGEDDSKDESKDDDDSKDTESKGDDDSEDEAEDDDDSKDEESKNGQPRAESKDDSDDESKDTPALARAGDDSGDDRGSDDDES